MTQRKELMKELGIRFHLSAETSMLVQFFKTAARRGDYEYFPKCKDLAAKVGRSPEVLKLLSKVSQSPWAKFVNISTVIETIMQDNRGSATDNVAQEIIKALLK